MKALLLCVLFPFSTLYSIAQQLPKTSYLVVRLQAAKDNFFNKHYLIIRAEEGNPAAADLYNLKEYDAGKGLSTAIAIYSEQRDSAQAYYNYFRNTTEALLFLSAKGWELISIFNEIVSGDQLARSTINGGDLVPISTVASRPIYYFKKEIN